MGTRGELRKMTDRASSVAMFLAGEWSLRPEIIGGIITPELVHKKQKENVLISHLERVDGGTADEFLASYHIDPAQAFFFEHSVKHVPGLMLVEASRQTAEAISHLYFDVPMDSGFILSELNCQFTRFAELAEPLFAIVRVDHMVRHGGTVVRLDASSTMMQHGSTVAKLSGVWRILSHRVYERVAGGALRPQPPAQASDAFA